MKRATPSALVVLLSFFLGACSPNQPSRTSDPNEGDQWYLKGEPGGSTAHINYNDIGYTGKGIHVAIVDDGIDIEHEDLRRNITNLNYSFTSISDDFSDAKHGTAVAGIIAAERGNGLGGVGIAPNASLTGYNALKVPTIQNIADALTFDVDVVDIYNNSWGDFNAWGEPFRIRPVIQDSLLTGVTLGRQGRGVVYVFAAGNGAENGYGLTVDNANYSGFVNNFFTIAVCAVTSEGVKAAYSEKGASLVVCAPSNGGEKSIFTTDVTGERGYNPSSGDDDIVNMNYTALFGGTSAAAPIVSGVVALLLEANPNLSWRDVRAILSRSAAIVDGQDTDWQTNGAGYKFNHKYGFGLIDAQRALQLAENWDYLDEIVQRATPRRYVSQLIPENIVGLHSSIEVDVDVTIEFVDIYFDAPDHLSLGDLSVTLTSPSGMQSVLAEPHYQLFEGFFRYDDWRFGSAAHFGESSLGEWILEVKDTRAGTTGTLNSWMIEFHGTQE